MAELAPLLVSGFEPFGGEQVNASWEAVSLLPELIDGHRVERLLLPVEFARAGELLFEEVCRLRPAAVLAVGEAGGRAHLTVERVAVNLMRGSIPDNAGLQPDGEPLVAAGPAAYLATIPVDACVAASRAAGVPAEPSESAGLYVCNSVLYKTLHYIAQGGLCIPAGFVHLPYLPQQVMQRRDSPFCPADLSARGLEACLRCILC